MLRGISKFFIPMTAFSAFLFSAGVHATVPEGDEAYQVHRFLKMDNMNFCSEELREGKDFQTNLESFDMKVMNLELGEIASEAQSIKRFPDEMAVGDVSYKLRHVKENGKEYIEVWPGGERYGDAEPLLKISSSFLDPKKVDDIKKSKGPYMIDVSGDGDGQAALLGPGGKTSPSLVRLLGRDLDIFCHQRSGGEFPDLLSNGMDSVIGINHGVMDESDSSDDSHRAKAKKRKLGGAHRRR